MRVTSFSQIPSDFVNKFYYFFDIDKEIKENQANQYINYKSWFETDERNYVTPNYTPLAYALLTTAKDDSLEMNLIHKFQKFDRVLRIYLTEYNNFIQIKVLLDMEIYDYELMDKLINDAEFSIKDSFRNKLIDFEYVPVLSNQKIEVANISTQLIYDKDTNEAVFEATYSFSYENPFENVLQANVLP